MVKKTGFEQPIFFISEVIKRGVKCLPIALLLIIKLNDFTSQHTISKRNQWLLKIHRSASGRMIEWSFAPYKKMSKGGGE